MPIESKRGLAFAEQQDIEITIATNAGACFGVVRAIKLGRQAVDRSETAGSPVYSFGPLIHNPDVVKDFESRGVQTVLDPGEVNDGTVILRSHGVRKEYEASLRDRGIQVVDATCPLVKKPQRIAKSLGEKGSFLVVVGDAKHPEVQGVVSYFGRPDYLITYNPDDVAAIPSEAKSVGVIAQTTIEYKVFESIVDRVKTRFEDVSSFNTICDATSVRQSEAIQLAERADVMVVVGGKNSSNTNKLVKICKDLQKDTYHIEAPAELEPQWFSGKRKIGVTGGASTPHEFVDLVGQTIAQMVGGH